MASFTFVYTAAEVAESFVNLGLSMEDVETLTNLLREQGATAAEVRVEDEYGIVSLSSQQDGSWILSAEDIAPERAVAPVRFNVLECDADGLATKVELAEPLFPLR